MLQSASFRAPRRAHRRAPPGPCRCLRQGPVGTRTCSGSMATALITSRKGLCPLPEGPQTWAVHREPYPARCHIASIHPDSVTSARGWCARSACNWKNECRGPLGLCWACAHGCPEMAVPLRREAEPLRRMGPPRDPNVSAQLPFLGPCCRDRTPAHETCAHVHASCSRCKRLETLQCPPVGVTATEKCLDLCVSAKGQPRGVSVMCQQVKDSKSPRKCA